MSGPTRPQVIEHLQAFGLARDVKFRALDGKTARRDVVRLANAAHLDDAEAGMGTVVQPTTDVSAGSGPLFAPGRIGRMTLRNRFVQAPIFTQFAGTWDEVGDRLGRDLRDAPGGHGRGASSTAQLPGLTSGG